MSEKGQGFRVGFEVEFGSPMDLDQQSICEKLVEHQWAISGTQGSPMQLTRLTCRASVRSS